ncbi:hypothetical protein PENNAL_c0178G07858 [Penicillium nalgiovense]|uniref:Uncharacterized protein n=1 Tax=Penicillium nalgiovense TaxID=60175 RepID=A0A1V6WWA3_PENNA|nr:hypothetical protein PENNAL_c0178G07858 [Penicillium nalgiovense]
MRMMDKIVDAATFLTENLHGTNTQELLYYHRQELQLAFDSLEKILGSPVSQQVQPSPSPNRGGTHSYRITTTNAQHRPWARDVLSSVPPQLHHPQPCSPARSEACLEPSFIQAQDERVEAINPLDHPQKTSDKISEFMRGLESQSQAIHHFLNLTEYEATARDNNWTGDDFFMIDIELSESRVTIYQKFRGWLARYLYAERYLTWAETTYSQPRTKFLVLNEKDFENRTKGRIKEYLIKINRNDEKNHRAIKYGVKYHSFGEIYGSHDVCAILSQVFSKFRNLSYRNFHSLAEEIHNSSKWSSLAREKANWLSMCLSIYSQERVEYEQKCGRKHSVTTEELPVQGQRKRARTSSSTVNAEASATADATANASPDNAPINQPVHENINPVRSLDEEPVTAPIGDYDPFQDFNLPPDFDPFQDFNLIDPSQGFDVL